MGLQKTIRSSTLVLVILFPSLFTMSCSTAHVHRNFQFKEIEGPSVKQEFHERKRAYYPTHYYDEVTLTLDGAKVQLGLHSGMAHGATFIGPLLVPFFPIFWDDHKISYALIEIQAVSTSGGKLEIQPDNVKISFDEGSFLKPVKSDSKSSLNDKDKKTQCFSFNFEKIPFPEQTKIVLDGFKLNGVPQKPISVTYTKDSYWHYVPFIFMHSD